MNTVDKEDMIASVIITKNNVYMYVYSIEMMMMMRMIIMYNYNNIHDFFSISALLVIT